MKGYLAKSSGGKKDASGKGRRSSFGNALVKFDKRFFALADGESTLKYWKTESDAYDGKEAKGELECVGSLVTVEAKEATFSLETRGRTLTMRATTEAERSAWVRALLDAGSSDHPLASHLAAHPADAGAVSGCSSVRSSRTSVSLPSACIERTSASGAARTFVRVPTGLKAGEQFRVQVPSGEKFSVTVPPGGGETIEIVIPARLAGPAPGEPGAGAAGATGAGGTAGDIGAAEAADIAAATAASAAEAAASAAAGGARGRERSSTDDGEWTLCRRFEVQISRPPGSPLGMALAINREGHPTLTDIVDGGVIAAAAQLQLGDMLLSINSAPITSLESAVDTLACCEGVIKLEVQRVEDEAALHQLLEQVSKEHHRAGASSSEALEREDDKQLRLALQESLSYRSEHESNRSKEEELRSRREEEELNAALATSLLAAVPPVPGSFADEANQIREAQQLAYAASLSAKASSSRRASSSGDGEHNPSAVSAANPTGTPTAAPPAATIPATCDASPSGPPAAGEQPPLSNSAPAVAGGGRGGSESNAVRALEEEAIAAGVASAADTAAAARSRRLSGAPHPEYPPDYEDVRETEEVYAAQHHFVLTQLTRPSVAAFLDSGSDTEVEDEGDVELGRSMRTNSKFV